MEDRYLKVTIEGGEAPEVQYLRGGATISLKKAPCKGVGGDVVYKGAKKNSLPRR
jgi:hypothetical protein